MHCSQSVVMRKTFVCDSCDSCTMLSMTELELHCPISKSDTKQERSSPIPLCLLVVFQCLVMNPLHVCARNAEQCLCDTTQYPRTQSLVPQWSSSQQGHRDGSSLDW